jgi:hypothetical protein
MNFQTSDSAFVVAFATSARSIQTLEGLVACAAGDAFVTGTKGESWPVPRDAFFRKYAPRPGVVAGMDGQYTKRLAFVQARQLDREETIELSDGRGTVTGQTGDWCLTYGIGNQAFIRSDIFSETYEPCKSVAVTIGVESTLLDNFIVELIDAETALRAALPHTPLIFTSGNVDDAYESPPWFRFARAKPSTGGDVTDAPIVLSLEEVTSGLGKTSLLDHISHLQSRTALSFTRDRFLGLLSSFFSESSEATYTELIAAQLAAIDELNAELQKGRASEFFIDAVPDELATAANDDLRRVGALADVLAVESQREWQQLVLADTKAIASLQNKSWFAKPFAMAWLLLGNSIVTLGMLAALGLAGFSELAEGCEAGDWFAWTGCTTEGWKQWVGFGAFALYIGALVIAWWRYAHAKASRCEGKHQDYRLLAECLRVQYVLSAIGETQCVADDFSAGRKAESSWVLLALRALTQQGRKLGIATDAGQGSANDSSAWAMKAFVEEQAGYHETTLIKRREHAIQVLSTMGRWGAGLFLVCLVLLIVNVMSKLLNHEAAVFSPMGQHVLLILQVAGLALWGSMRKVMDTFALEQEVQRGRIVLDALKRANASDKQSIIQAAKLFAQDQAAWHALRRSKPVEATTGGG